MKSKIYVWGKFQAFGASLVCKTEASSRGTRTETFLGINTEINNIRNIRMIFAFLNQQQNDWKHTSYERVRDNRVGMLTDVK